MLRVYLSVVIPDVHVYLYKLLLIGLLPDITTNETATTTKFAIAIKRPPLPVGVALTLILNHV